MSSEEVLLIVKHVKVKKSEGRLYMMGSRMAWMQASSDTFAISHYYADIRGLLSSLVMVIASTSGFTVHLKR